jgi:pimeloyl-ACP methyl ester carboxylesterase
MPTLRTPDAQLFYEVVGNGPDVLLLHPFPLNHHFWKPAAEQLSTRYRLIMPDLRAHGDSELGEGPATMQKLAADLAALCREEHISKAFFVGVSIGGYLLFEFWRRNREQVSALVLSNTRASAETPEGRANRLALADRVLREGTSGFIEEMLTKLTSPETQRNRPDIVEAARRMMHQMSPHDIAGVQQGMADRPDSISTLKTIDVPALIMVGESEAKEETELMYREISGSRMQVVPHAGHYAALEQPEEFGRSLRGFFDELRRS